MAERYLAVEAAGQDADEVRAPKIAESIFNLCLRARSRRAATKYSNARKGSGKRGRGPSGWKGVEFSNLWGTPGESNEASNTSTPAEDKSRERPSTMRSVPPVPLSEGINNRRCIVSGE